MTFDTILSACIAANDANHQHLNTGTALVACGDPLMATIWYRKAERKARQTAKLKDRLLRMHQEVHLRLSAVLLAYDALSPMVRPYIPAAVRDAIQKAKDPTS